MDGRVEPKSPDGDLEGLDDTQRAELHAYEGGGPTDGIVLTDMARDHGEDYVEDEIKDEITPETVEDIGMTDIEDLLAEAESDDEDTDTL